jgi:hypothetical protein
MITRILASALLLSACVADGPADDEDGGLDGKADAANPTRTLTFSVDHRPSDGALVEVSVEPRTGGKSAIVVEHTAFNRAVGHDVYDRSVLFARGTCELDLDAISCVSDADKISLDAQRTDAAWLVVSTTDGEKTPYGGSLTVSHARFSRYTSASRTRVELLLDAGETGMVATLRTTYLDRTTNTQETRALLDGATCTFDSGAMACAVDRRPVDGVLSELHVDPIGDGAYVATLRTAGVQRTGEFDHTETLAKSLSLR